MPRGHFITFEGPDGSGKTTQLRKLAEALEAEGRRVVTLRQPGGTALGDRIRGVLLDSRTEASVGTISPGAELALMFADRAQAVAQVILPALEAGHIVLCDRFTDSSEAYQGGGRRLGSAQVLELHRALFGSLQPDLTLLLLPSLARSLARARRRNKKQTDADENRFEQEPDEFHQRIDTAYREIARRDAGRVVAIESDESIDSIHERIRAVVAERLQ